MKGETKKFFKKKYIMKFILYLFLGFFFLGTSLTSYAATPPAIEFNCTESGVLGCNESTDANYKEHYFFRTLVPAVLTWVMTLAASLGVAMGVAAGVMYLFAGGNEELVGRATKTITYAGIGIVVAMFSYFIVEVINRLPFANS